MGSYNANDIYILQHLRSCGLTGQPFGNLVTGSHFPAEVLLDSLKRLEEGKLIRLKGKATLQDLEKKIAETGPIPTPLMSPDFKSWTATNSALFHGISTQESLRFFYTTIRLTLRGHAMLPFMKKVELKDIAKPKPNGPKQ